MTTTWVWACMECGRKFKTARAAARASYNGCPSCGGVDIDNVPVEADEGSARHPEGCSCGAPDCPEHLRSLLG